MNAMSGISQAIIITAGRTIRLGSLTKDRAKPMLPVLGKPMIIRVMDRIKEAGITNFVVVVGEQDGEVASYLHSGWAPDAKVQIVLQPMMRGAADALAAAANYITDPFLITSCDHLVPVDHIRALMRDYNQGNPDMVVSLTPYTYDLGLPYVTLQDDRITAISQGTPPERRAQSAFLMYACNKRVLNYTSSSVANDYEMVKVIQSVLSTNGCVKYHNVEWYMPLTRDLDLLHINKRLLREGRDTHILSEIPGSVHIVPPVRIDPQVSIGQGAKIGPNVYLESGVQVGAEAVIWDSIVIGKAEIADHEVLHGQIVLRRQRISEEPEAAKTRPTRPIGLQELFPSGTPSTPTPKKDESAS
jgi:NDP-sugar pyrophosphorylase family protein